MVWGLFGFLFGLVGWFYLFSFKKRGKKEKRKNIQLIDILNIDNLSYNGVISSMVMLFK